MPQRRLSVNHKGTIIIECDKCGKQNFIKRKNIDRGMWRDLTNNQGILCSDCERENRSTEPRVSYLFGMFYTIYPDIISIQHLQGIKRAKEILVRGELQ